MRNKTGAAAKRISALLLCVVLMLGMVPTAAFAADETPAVPETAAPQMPSTAETATPTQAPVSPPREHTGVYPAEAQCGRRVRGQ